MSVARKLGRGLKSLMLEDPLLDSVLESREIVSLDVLRVDPDPNQPRSEFDETRLEELADSIKAHGVIQPIIVRPSGTDSRYVIVAGERRWRAAKLAQLDTIPAIVFEPENEDQVLQMQLVENIQREDLNPIDKAKGYKTLMTRFNLTQEEVAGKVGQSRATVANMLRLLDLPLDIQESVIQGTLTMGHARALLSLNNPMQQRALASRIVQEGLSVREIERTVGELQRNKLGTTRRPQERPKPKPAHISDIEDRLRRALGCKVDIQCNPNNCGKIIISFADNEDFERILERLGISVAL